MPEEPQFCECGCGELAKPGCRFIWGHVNRGRKHSQKTREENSARRIQYFIDNPEAKSENSARRIQYFIDNPEAGKSHSERMIEYWSDQSKRDKQRDRLYQFNRNNPEAGKIHSKFMVNYFTNQNNRDNLSKIKKQFCIDNPEVIEKMIGGDDLVWHHIAYDFLRTETLRVRINRKFHGTIHHPKGIPLTERGYSLID